MDILKYLWCVKVKVKVAQSCQTPWDPMDCSPPGSSVLGILQARLLQWVATSFSNFYQKLSLMSDPMLSTYCSFL